jgi:hypothetical protein
MDEVRRTKHRQRVVDMRCKAIIPPQVRRTTIACLATAKKRLRTSAPAYLLPV